MATCVVSIEQASIDRYDLLSNDDNLRETRGISSNRYVMFQAHDILNPHERIIYACYM